MPLTKDRARSICLLQFCSNGLQCLLGVTNMHIKDCVCSLQLHIYSPHPL